MLCAIIADSSGHGIWNSDTIGLIFTYGILLPALVTGLIVVSIVSGRGDRKADREMRGRWGRKRPPSDS